MKYNLIVFDIDGTLTNNPNPWLTIHYFLATWSNLTENYRRMYLDGEITYSEFCKLEVMHWRGAKSADISNLFSNLKTPANLFEALTIFREMNFRLVCISTGVQFVSQKLGFESYFDDIFCNEICIKDGVLTGDVKINVDNKIRILNNYISNLGDEYSLDKTIIIGDGDNDVEIAKNVGYSIAFCSNSEQMTQVSKYHVDEFDYSKIIEKIRGFCYDKQVLKS